jgi:hypothetical protein
LLFSESEEEEAFRVETGKGWCSWMERLDILWKENDGDDDVCKNDVEEQILYKLKSSSKLL